MRLGKMVEPVLGRDVIAQVVMQHRILLISAFIICPFQGCLTWLLLDITDQIKRCILDNE